MFYYCTKVKFKREKPEVIFAAYFEPYPNTWQPVTRNTENDGLGQAFMAYENGAFDTAIDRFLGQMDQGVQPEVRFYLGMSYLAQNKYVDALEIFQTLQFSNPAYQEEINWYEGLAYLGRVKWDWRFDHLNRTSLQDKRVIMKKKPRIFCESFTDK